jgi:hypothetical protein
MFHPDDVKKRHPLYFRFSHFYRKRRMEFFLTHFCIRGDEKILDAGGEAYFWESIPQVSDVTLLNVVDAASPSTIRRVVYGGGKFPFADREFDIVFSNSTIEHVGDFNDRRLFAAEVQRCGNRFFVQTPSFWFPYEPHAFIPFFQFLPPPLKKLTHRFFSKSPYPVEDLLNIHLLTKKELRVLFPGAHIVRELFLFLTKSYFIMNKR